MGDISDLGPAQMEAEGVAGAMAGVEAKKLAADPDDRIVLSGPRVAEKHKASQAKQS